MTWEMTMPETMAPRISCFGPGFPNWRDGMRPYTYARHEKQVRRQREEGDIRCFLPLYRSIRRWKDRHKELELVLFPGYIFVHVGPKARLFVLQTPGGVRLACVKGHPAVLEDWEIESRRSGIANAAH